MPNTSWNQKMSSFYPTPVIPMKDCPFCGGSAFISWTGDGVHVECENCHSRTMTIKTSWYSSKKNIWLRMIFKAIKKWEKRK